MSEATLWNNTAVDQTERGRTYIYTVGPLNPATDYLFRLRVIYNNSEYHTYTWPRDPVYKFSTLGDVPGPPGAVKVQQTEDEAGDTKWHAVWSHAVPHGPPITIYVLQVAPVTSDFPSNLSFVTVYNGSSKI